MLPVLNGSPTSWNMYTALKESKKLRKSVYYEIKKILTFNLRLYIKAIRLQKKNDIKSSFAFRMGELHVVFCVLKVIGKVINESGLNQVFEEVGKQTITYEACYV